MGAILLVLLGSGLLRNRFLSAQRQGENVETFVEFLEFYGFNPEIARSAYQYLEQEEGLAFPIRYSDFLEEDLRLSDEEVRQMVLHLLRTFGRVPQFGMRHAPLLTVEHVLRFVQACPFEAIMRSSGQGVDRSLSSAYRAAFRSDESSGSIMAATMANTKAAVLGKREGVEFPRVRLE